MRTLLLILGGFALWGGILGAARLLGGSARVATLLFAVLWFAVAAGNLYIGVARAGYTVREELPIFLLIFLLPAVVALAVARRGA